MTLNISHNSLVHSTTSSVKLIKIQFLCQLFSKFWLYDIMLYHIKQEKSHNKRRWPQLCGKFHQRWKSIVVLSNRKTTISKETNEALRLLKNRVPQTNHWLNPSYVPLFELIDPQESRISPNPLKSLQRWGLMLLCWYLPVAYSKITSNATSKGYKPPTSVSNHFSHPEELI